MKHLTTLRRNVVDLLCCVGAPEMTLFQNITVDYIIRSSNREKK
jgi:hypothetical protein